MTAEELFQFYRAYKFFYAGFNTYRPDGSLNLRKAPPLLKQRDRRFYYRLAQKLTDPQIHQLFIHEFFYNPSAHVSTMVTPDAIRRGLAFCGRAENGRTRYEHDLYELKKGLDVQQFLYGIDEDGKQGMMPGCLQDVIARQLPIDLAALLLLHPQPDLNLDWAAYWKSQPDLGLGARSWVDRLERLHILLKKSRKLWKTTVPADLAFDFWHSFDVPLTPQLTPTAPSLF